VNCPACQVALPDDAVFCGHCGSALRRERACARCGRDNAPEMRFCLGCGASLATSGVGFPVLSQSADIQHLTWQQEEPAWLADLAQAYLGEGRQDEAERTASEALALAQARGLELHELRAWYALARVVIRTDAARARDALARAAALVERTHAHAYAPFLSLERAELARLLDDETTYRRELREAHRLFTAMGATGHAERIEALSQREI